MTGRTYPVPIAERSPVLGDVATLDEIDLAATLGSTWARRVLDRENTRVLGRVLGEDRVLPVGVLDDDGLIIGLWRGGLSWQTHGWVASGAPARTELLDLDTVAFVARAIEEGTPVLTLPYTPVALLSASYPIPGTELPDPPTPPPGSPPTPPTASTPNVKSPPVPGAKVPGGKDTTPLPPGAKVLAVVDEYDHNAVMDLVVVLPGPKVMRRHDGEWRDDPTWLSVLRGVRPPPVVEVPADQQQSVIDQVDQATAGTPFNKTDEAKAGKDAKKPVAASGWMDRDDQMHLAWALVAANQALKAKVKGKAYDIAGVMPPALKKYWTVGEGAAKIRWGTPGAMTRCHRHLLKYVGTRAYAVCNNLSKPLGGRGVAWDVG